ncbi:MAG: hypothetical protein IT334_13235 [Thermomicrobiales bacterium]|nr:hypothetical protein [Thermomicrobiales bacterium]
MVESKVAPRDRRNVQTPLRCPICDGALSNTVIRDLGGITVDITWQMHAGECPEHGWFQTEIVSRPPREIFAVDRPFGIARRMVIDGVEQYSFPTVWMYEPPKVARSKVDPFDERYWRTQRSLRR